MRKLLSAVVALFLMAGIVVAAEVTITKFDKDKKEVTVKDGDKEATYTISDKTKVAILDKDGNAKDGKIDEFEKRLAKLPKGGIKVDITTDKNAITEIKIKGGKK
ncbi:MAG: hypothetical protein K8U57_07735 [Planctomycetes bacterium]|nr:hypothetical protein [Planctomycetota bacterium]